MDLESAINTAIEFETRVFESYRQAKSQATDPKGKRIFEVLCNEEQGHIDYLQHRLHEWKTSGKVTPEKLGTAVPSKQRIAEGVKRLGASMKDKPSKGGSPVEIELLHKALQAEQETSAFYLRMVSELPAEGRDLFARFLEIEQGHVAIVQAEIDSVTGLGFWFDIQEFSLEAS
jgi:rubrerythrin